MRTEMNLPRLPLLDLWQRGVGKTARIGLLRNTEPRPEWFAGQPSLRANRRATGLPFPPPKTAGRSSGSALPGLEVFSANGTQRTN